MTKVIGKMSLLVSVCFIAGCSSYTQNQDIGTVTGAVAGGLLGSTIGGGAGKAIAIGVGAVGGALVGNAVGRSMDEQNSYNYYHPTYPGDYYYYGQGGY